MIRRRIYLRPEGWYYVFVIAFVLGGAVLRNVNLLVALGGLMVAALVIHWQLVVRSLSGLQILRTLPPRLCAGDQLDVEVTVRHAGRTGTAWALNYSEKLERIDPPGEEPALQIKLLFPRISPGETVTRNYNCEISRRGIYRFNNASVVSRFPLGLVEGSCFLDLPDLLVVYPRLGKLNRSWTKLIEAGNEGQQSTNRRRGLLEADFHALRPWRSGDSRRWIHWRTSAKLGTLAVKEYEQRLRCDVALVLDLWEPETPTDADRAMTEAIVSFAATAIVDLCRHGGSRLTVLVASSQIGQWSASASPLFGQELLEHLAVCRATTNVRLAEASDRLGESMPSGVKALVLSTRSKADAVATVPRRASKSGGTRWLDHAVWLSAAAADLEQYFSLEDSHS